VKAKARIYLLVIVASLVLLTAAIYWLLPMVAAAFRLRAATAPALKVKLYYYNKTKDIGPTGIINCSPDAVLPVEREIPRTATPIADTIRLLIEGNLTDAERAAGFSTEFPHPRFTLLRADLKDGVLTLAFPEVPGFTMGGAARVTLLAAQIEKTARQFPEVKEVRLEPESLFQP
jgi:spore germination protein GerM